jgi:ribonuclease P protein component
MVSRRRTGGAGHGGESFPAARRLRRRQEFLKTYQTGRRVHGRLVVIFGCPAEDDGLRLGITVPKKVGNATIRNRLRRQVREIFRRSPAARTAPPCLLVVNVSPRAAAASFTELRDEIERLLSCATEQPT